MLCQIEDYRAEDSLLQSHYGFIAHVADDKRDQNLDEKEKADKVYLEMLTLSELSERFDSQKAQTRQQELLRQRDLLILTEALNYLDKRK